MKDHHLNPTTEYHMPNTSFGFHLPGANLLLKATGDGEWTLFCNGHEVCTYSSPERAARFVSHGRTGNRLIDAHQERPRDLRQWWNG
jgi:hypothetical protein